MKRSVVFLLLLVIFSSFFAYAIDEDETIWAIETMAFFPWAYSSNMTEDMLVAYFSTFGYELKEITEKKFFFARDGLDGAIAANIFGPNEIGTITYAPPVTDEDFERTLASVEKIWGKGEKRDTNLPNVTQYSWDLEDSVIITINDARLWRDPGIYLTFMPRKDAYYFVIEDKNIFSDEAVRCFEEANEAVSSKVVLASGETANLPIPSTLSPGEYACPAHIAAGEYRVIPQEIAHIAVYRDGSLKTNEALIANEGDEIGRLVLKSGDSLEISGGNLDFIPLQ